MNDLRDLIGYQVGVMNEEVARRIGGYKVIQCFVSNPGFFDMPDMGSLEVCKELQMRGKRVIIHLPFGVSMVKDNGGARFLLRYAKRISLGLDILHMRGTKLVVHTNKVGKNFEGETILPQMIETLAGILNLNRGNEFLIETDAGIGSRDTTYRGIKEAIDKVSCKGIVGICVDTEHSFASGVSPGDILLDREYVKVIHMNSIPKGVVKGSGKDRHSDTPLRESQDTSFIKPYVEFSIKNNVPMILERNEELVEGDISYMEEEWLSIK